MRMMILCVCVLGLAAGCSIEREHLNAQGEHLSAQGGSAPKNLEGLWLLEVENLRHKTITTATIRFTDEKVPSCLGEGWKRVVVESHDSSHEDSFPVTGLLSYEARGNALAIGRNEVCDAYVHLEGEFKGSSVEGNYVTFGWGREHLGYFSLRPIAE